MADDLLGDLIRDAYAHFADSDPVVLACDVDVEDAPSRSAALGEGPKSSTYLLPDGLYRLSTRTVSVDAWSSTVREEHALRPVLGVPPWGRYTAREPVKGIRDIQEQLLADVGSGTGQNPLGFLIPAQSMTGQSSRVFRELLRADWHPVVVLYATGGISGVHPSYEVVFVLALPTSSSLPTKFFRLPNRREVNPETVREDFGRLLKRGGGRGEFGFVERTLPAAEASLAFDVLDPELHAQRAALGGFGSTTKLGELFEVLPSVHLLRLADKGALVESVEPGAVRVLRGRDVRPGGTIDAADDDSPFAAAAVVADRGASLRDGDLVIRALHPKTSNRPLVVATIQGLEGPVAAGNTLIALRPRRRLAEAHRRLLRLFLTSSATSRLVQASTHPSGMQVSRTGLMDVVVPEPDSALSDAIEDLASAALQFDVWSEQARQILDSVFDDPSPRDSRARLIEEGRDLRLKVEASSLVDDFDYRVRTRFPYPLAYRWRTVEAYASGDDWGATHAAVLETFEVLLCYTSMLAHVMARSAGITLGATVAIRSKLASGKSGPGLGDWVAVMDEVASSRAVAQLAADQPLVELKQLLAPSVTEARGRLTERRLGQAHLRRVTAEQFEAQVKEELDDLRAMFQQAAFLTDLPLLHLDRTALDTISNTTQITYRQLMGDHPVLPYQSMTVSRTDLEMGSLYVMDTQGGLHLLRPFLVGRDCPHCSTWSTFHVDRTSKGVLGIKSLEHGHALDAPELTSAARSVGLM